VSRNHASHEENIALRVFYSGSKTVNVCTKTVQFIKKTLCKRDAVVTQLYIHSTIQTADVEDFRNFRRERRAHISRENDTLVEPMLKPVESV